MTKLELIRRCRGWSQGKLAAYLGIGFTGSAVSLIESGRLKPSLRQAERLQTFLGIAVEELLANADEPSVAPMASTEFSG